MSARVIVPKKLSVNPAKMAQAITNALNGVALDAKVDFEVTVQTWQHKASFSITSPSTYQRQVGTDDANYARLNAGTRPHPISPRPGGTLVFQTPFRSKTVPHSISSGPGGTGGATVFTRKTVRHPGTQAREFDKVIAQKWDRLFAGVMQRAIDAAV